MEGRKTTIKEILEKYDIEAIKKIRIDCYLAKLKDYRKRFPNSHFEVITRVAKSPLAPSKELLIEAGIFKKKDGTKNPRMNFEKYKIKFMNELDHNAAATLAFARLLDLYDQGKTIFLVCYEKDPEKCHRSIVKQALEIIIKKREKNSTDIPELKIVEIKDEALPKLGLLNKKGVEEFKKSQQKVANIIDRLNQKQTIKYELEKNHKNPYFEKCLENWNRENENWEEFIQRTGKCKGKQCEYYNECSKGAELVENIIDHDERVKELRKLSKSKLIEYIIELETDIDDYMGIDE